MTGALDGVRVVDFGHFVAGPLLAELLAQNGAEVVHIDPPSGPRLPGFADAVLNRGKDRVALDMTTPQGRSAAQQLVGAADVVVENFRPGVMDRWGLGAAALTRENPGLVYCSLPGFAADDPRSALQAWEGVVMAATAGYRRLREHWDWKGRAHADVDDAGRPLFTALPIASNTAALLGALRVVSALYRRERTGAGAVLEVPLAEAMLEVIGFHLEMPDFVGPREDLPKAFLGSYRCSDGRFVDQVSYPRHVERLLRACGEWDAWVADGLGDMPTVFTDPELKWIADRRFAALIATRPAAYWEGIVLDLGSAAAQVRLPQEWVDNEHARESRTVVDIEDPEFGTVSMAGLALDLSATPAAVRPRVLPGDSVDPAPTPHTSTAVPATSTDTAPLVGVSVLELSQVVAGPISGRLLADLGASVVKVANPAPDGNNGFHGSFTNRGKQTAFVDLKDPQDVAMVRAAAAGTDVFLQNYAHGAIERYGLGYDDLGTQRPDLVYVSMSAYSRSGQWRHRRGHENQAVAVTGLSARYGGPTGWPLYQPYLICDVGTGIMGALGAVLGLFHRARSGRGQHISTSLTNVATLHQGIYLTDSAAHADIGLEPQGVDALGWSSTQRLYRCADGWVFLGAATEQCEALLVALGVEDVPLADADVESCIANAARGMTRSRFAAATAGVGVTVHPVRELSEVANDPAWHARGVLRHSTNGEGKISPVLGFAPSPWRTPPHSADHPGPLGNHTTPVRDRYRCAATSAP